MKYNYNFEISALIFMGLIFIHFMAVKQFPTRKTRLFRLFLIISILDSLVNVASSIAIANTTLIPLWINQLLAITFFILQSIDYYILYLYTVIICGFHGEKYKVMLRWGLIPFSFSVFFALITPITGFYFYFDEGMKYHQGFGANFGYFYIMLFLCIDFILAAYSRRKKSLKITDTALIYVYSGLAIVALSIQFLFRNILLTGMLRSIIIIIMFFSLHKPNEYIDMVTGLFNFNSFQLVVEHKIDKKERFYLVYLDLLRFRYVNLVYGYDYGNMVLESVGEYLQSTTGIYKAFHMFNDTFCLVIQKSQSLNDLTNIIKARFEEPWYIKDKMVQLKIIMAVASYPENFNTISEVEGLKNYLFTIAKKQGQRELIVSNDAISRDYHRITEVEIALNRALQEKTLEVFYQPIYSVKEERIVSLEVLARIIDAKIGFIPPDEFIPIAEKNGSIILLGNLVFEKTCQFIKKYLLDDRYQINMVNINLSVIQLMQNGMIDNFKNIMTTYKIPPKMINLEITEMAAISEHDLVLEKMVQLQEMGICFSLDDYGTGNSNCSYLIKLPFQTVKFDKNMIWSYFEDDIAHIILENEFSTIQKLGIPIVAEGIETELQKNCMSERGIEYLQGYYYSKPIPEKEIIEYLNKFNDTID